MKTADEILKMVNEFWTICHTTENLSLFTNRSNMSSQWGGKRIRPTLMLLAYNLYKDNPEDILMNACAFGDLS